MIKRQSDIYYRTKWPLPQQYADIPLRYLFTKFLTVHTYTYRKWILCCCFFLQKPRLLLERAHEPSFMATSKRS